MLITLQQNHNSKTGRKISYPILISLLLVILYLALNHLGERVFLFCTVNSSAAVGIEIWQPDKLLWQTDSQVPIPTQPVLCLHFSPFPFLPTNRQPIIHAVRSINSAHKVSIETIRTNPCACKFSAYSSITGIQTEVSAYNREVIFFNVIFLDGWVSNEPWCALKSFLFCA